MNDYCQHRHADGWCNHPAVERIEIPLAGGSIRACLCLVCVKEIQDEVGKRLATTCKETDGD